MLFSVNHDHNQAVFIIDPEDLTGPENGPLVFGEKARSYLNGSGHGGGSPEQEMRIVFVGDKNNVFNLYSALINELELSKISSDKPLLEAVKAASIIQFEVNFHDDFHREKIENDFGAFLKLFPEGSSPEIQIKFQSEKALEELQTSLDPEASERLERYRGFKESLSSSKEFSQRGPDHPNSFVKVQNASQANETVGCKPCVIL